VLAKYGELVPGAPERIITMAEKQSQHRQQLEAEGLRAQINDDRAQRIETRLGQVFGLIIAALAIGAGVTCVVVAPSAAGATTGSVIGGGGVIGLVYAFRYGRKLAEQESE